MKIMSHKLLDACPLLLPSSSTMLAYDGFINVAVSDHYDTYSLLYFLFHVQTNVVLVNPGKKMALTYAVYTDLHPQSKS